MLTFVRRPAPQSYKLQRCSSASAPGSSRASPSAAAGPLRSAASETDALLPPVSDLLASLPLELRGGGLRAGLDAALARSGDVLLVVREALVDEARAALELQDARVVPAAGWPQVGQGDIGAP